MKFEYCFVENVQLSSDAQAVVCIVYMYIYIFRIVLYMFEYLWTIIKCVLVVCVTLKRKRTKLLTHVQYNSRTCVCV